MSGADPTERGEQVIAAVAERAGLAADAYDTEVVVAEDVEGAILDAVDEYDTVCVGLSERSDASRIMFGTIAERLGRNAAGHVAIVRAADGTTGASRDPSPE